jgi:hypothetical protein
MRFGIDIEDRLQIFFGKDTECVVINTSEEGQISVWAEVPKMIINLFVRFS